MFFMFILFHLALCDIGSAAFNYDMRRLTEILDVPKAWYKRSLMQRLLLGKDGVYAAQTSMNQSTKSTPNTNVNIAPTLHLPSEQDGNNELRSAQKAKQARRESVTETPKRNPSKMSFVQIVLRNGMVCRVYLKLICYPMTWL